MAVTTVGTTIAIGDGGGTEVFTTIAGAKDFSGPSGSVSVIDVTALNDTAKQKMVGMEDEGQFSFNLNWNAADVQHALLRTNFAAQTQTNFKITLSDTTVITFAAFITGFDHSGAVDGVYEASITLEITGAITIA